MQKHDQLVNQLHPPEVMIDITKSVFEFAPSHNQLHHKETVIKK